MKKIVVKVGNMNDLHLGYHKPLVRHPNERFIFEFAKPRIRCGLLKKKRRAFNPLDNYFHYEVHQYPAQAKFIHSAFYPVSNKVPWIAEMSDVAVPLIGRSVWNVDFMNKFHGLFLKDPSYKKAMLKRISLYNTPYCKAILFWSIAGMVTTILRFMYYEILDTPEVLSFLKKSWVAYPAIKPMVKKVRLQDPRTVLFMARDFINKGGHIALRAFELLNKWDPGLELIYCGPIPESHRKQHARLLSRIKYYPAVEQQKAFQLLKRSDILLMPTLSENFGMILLEAQAAGCAPIAYYGEEAAAIKEIISNGRTGLLVRVPGKIDEQKEARRFFSRAKGLLSDPAKLKALKRSALSEIKHGKFSFSKHIRMLDKLFRSPLEADLPVPESGQEREIAVYGADQYQDLMNIYRKQHNIPNRIYIKFAS